MADRIITLCPKCAELMKEGYNVKEVKTTTTTERGPICKNCGRRAGMALGQYVVGKK